MRLFLKRDKAVKELRLLITNHNPYPNPNYFPFNQQQKIVHCILSLRVTFLQAMLQSSRNRSNDSNTNNLKIKLDVNFLN